MHQVLSSYLRRLTNLSHNNRSLYLPRLLGQQYVDMHQLDQLNGFSSFRMIEWLIADGQHELEGVAEGIVPLCPVVDSRQAGSNATSQRLKQLARNEKFFYEEQGSRDLYVGWPFVRGRFSDNTLVRAPLLFFPVALETHQDDALGHQWVLRPRADVAVSLNKSFLLAYAHYNQLPYDDTLAERTFDDFDRDSRVFRTSLYQLFKDTSVEINFNQEIFVDALQPFTTFTKADLEAQTETGELKLFPEAVLGIFPQAGSYLVPDYIKLAESSRVPDLETFFVNRSSAEQRTLQRLESVDQSLAEVADLPSIRRASQVKEEQIFAPYRLDAYQEKALRQIKQGDSMVVQGPPGTGKSQLIVNLMADYAAQGKRVLLVCQKRAALDVVYERLKAHGVHPFVARVHDFKNDRKAVYEQVSKQVDAIYEYQLKNNSLDSIFMERNFLQYSRRIEQICEELDDFKQALFDEHEAGVSVKELYLTSDLRAPVINVKQEYRHFKVPDLPPFLRKLRTYVNYAARLDDEHYLLSTRQPFAHYTAEDYRQMKEVTEDIPVFKNKIVETVSGILGSDIDFVTCESLQHRIDDIRRLVKVLSEDTSYRFFQQSHGAIPIDADPQWLEEIEQVVRECYTDEGPEVSLSPERLGEFQRVVAQAEEARSGAVQWAWWKNFSKDKKFVQEVFTNNHLALDKEGFARMTPRLDARLNLEHKLTELREVNWTQEVPNWETSDHYAAPVFTEWFHHQKQALTAGLLFHKLRNFNEYLPIKHLTYAELKDQLEKLITELEQIPPRTQRWAQYLTPAQVAQLNTTEQSERFIQVLEQDFDALADFDTLKDSLTAYEVDVVNRLLEETTALEEDKVVHLFENSVRLTWIDHIETKYPVLRIVSSDKLSDLETELQQAIEDKLTISQEILLMKLRERTYYNVEYNRLSNMVTYRDLNHQINKKRKIWPLRKVVENFHNELFNLVPCWLASPETVSAVFPMSETPLFDLVIFDEASQCFAEKGIPAMYRSQQVVVVGDDQQLRPHDLYTARWTDSEETDRTEDAIALESESLLDLSQHYLRSVRLEGHYRSRSLDLIDFSNRHFYEEKLRMLPTRATVNRHEPAIRYLHVEGQWEQQTNAVESQRVVALVQELVSTHPEQSIGVITFNSKQRELILDDLERAKPTEQAWPASLFVKNIENVQGDERDIIIFSVAYAPDKQGKVRMQFGSLNAAGGENRLNVAITRARTRVYVVTSILPNQLKTDQLKNEGPKLFKQYLSYAQMVSEGRFSPTLPQVSAHRTAWFLSHQLARYTEEALEAYQTARLLPFADLTLIEKDRQPPQYVGLINTDDDQYHQAESVKDTHAYLPRLYRDKDWKFTMIYSRQYWNHTEQVQEALQRFVRESEDVRNPAVSEE